MSKQIRGNFHNCYHNYNHDKNDFSIAEKQYKDYCLKHGLDLSDIEHEFKFRFKYAKGSETKKSLVHLDFLHVSKKIIVEINPNFHYKFKPVIERDKRKIKALRKHGFRVFRIKVFIGMRKRKYTTKLNLKYAWKVIQEIKKASESKEQLGFYTKDRAKPIKALNISVCIPKLKECVTT